MANGFVNGFNIRGREEAVELLNGFIVMNHPHVFRGNHRDVCLWLKATEDYVEKPPPEPINVLSSTVRPVQTTR